MWIWFIPVILGVVEGLTEFLPVSSTGHLIVAGHALGFDGEFAETFEVSIQLGAILAVVVFFRKRLTDLLRRLPTDPAARTLVIGLALAVIPAGMVGVLAHQAIKAYLFNPKSVAVALIVGGIAILAIEAGRPRGVIEQLEAVRLRDALWVGVAQTTALFPGVSRAGATIMGGLLVGMDRRTATEFSFFLALPTMFVATLFDAYQGRSSLSGENLGLLAVGMITAFFTALAVISVFLAFVQRYSFRVFAYYRIVFGFLVLFFFWS